MSAWDSAIQFVLEAEGGYVDDPHDAGGETNFGISKRCYPTLDIRGLTREQAVDLYRRDYWEPAGCEKLPGALAVAVFDAAVNMGTGTAVRSLQEALGVTVDGVIGPATLAAVASQTPRALLVTYLANRVIRYAGMAEFRVYAGTWVRRCFRLHQVCLGREGGSP